MVGNERSVQRNGGVADSRPAYSVTHTQCTVWRNFINQILSIDQAHHLLPPSLPFFLVLLLPSDLTFLHFLKKGCPTHLGTQFSLLPSICTFLLPFLRCFRRGNSRELTLHLALRLPPSARWLSWVHSPRARKNTERLPNRCRAFPPQICSGRPRPPANIHPHRTIPSQRALPQPPSTVHATIAHCLYQSSLPLALPRCRCHFISVVPPVPPVVCCARLLQSARRLGNPR